MIDLSQAREIDVCLHIGLHKTASTFMQNKLLGARYDLLLDGVLYPMAGHPIEFDINTREGAQSGQTEFTRSMTGAQPALEKLPAECDSKTRSILISAENFSLWKRSISPEEYLQRFSNFRSVKVVLVLRRQDDWIKSYYKQIVDGFIDYESRTLEQFVADEGDLLLDFYSRFKPWRDVVGPENFHLISYDDVDSADDILRTILKIAGAGDPLIKKVLDFEVPGYQSVSDIDTFALRILNSLKFKDRSERVRVARLLREMTPDIKYNLMDPALRARIQEKCLPINQRIVSEWTTGKWDNFCFGQPRDHTEVDKSFDTFLNYLGNVIMTVSTAKDIYKSQSSYGEKNCDFQESP